MTRGAGRSVEDASNSVQRWPNHGLSLKNYFWQIETDQNVSDPVVLGPNARSRLGPKAKLRSRWFLECSGP